MVLSLATTPFHLIFFMHHSPKIPENLSMPESTTEPLSTPFKTCSLKTLLQLYKSIVCLNICCILSASFLLAATCLLTNPPNQYICQNFLLFSGLTATFIVQY